MILDALQTTLAPILSSYVAIGYITATVPFCVYQVEPNPLRTKDGIVGYTQKVSIAIIHNDVDALETKSVAVKSAISAMLGTVSGCVINSAIYDGETGVTFDAETETYQNNLDFTFDTDTR